LGDEEPRKENFQGGITKRDDLAQSGIGEEHIEKNFEKNDGRQRKKDPVPESLREGGEGAAKECQGREFYIGA